MATSRQDGLSAAPEGWDVVRAVAWRTWLITWRRPVHLAFSLGQPLIWILFFGFLFQRYRLDLGVTSGDVAYLDFLAPGVSVMTVLFGASQVGTGWIRDLQTGFLPRLLNTPVRPGLILAGKILADVVRLVLQALVVLALAAVVGARLRPAAGALLPALAALTLFAAAMSALSCVVALRVKAQEAMGTYVHLVNMPLLFTSTALVPGRQMPGWLAALSRWSPLTATVEAWRGALLSGEAPASTTLLLPLAALCVLLFLAALPPLRQAAARY
jgi:ABC-2 type transport system permease protein